MNKKIFLYLAIFGSISVQAQERWSLRQCIDYAIEHNISIRQTANAAEQSAVEVNTAKWARLPNLNASAGQSWNWGRTQTAIKNEDTGDYSTVYVNTSSHGTNMSVNTSIPIFTGLEIPHQYALAKLNLKAAIADLDKAKEDIAINIASAYLQVLFNEELHQVALGQVQLSKEQYVRISRLADLGKASPAELAEAKARVAQDEMSAVQADNNYRLALLDLSQLLELPTPDGFRIASPKVDDNFNSLSLPEDIYADAVLTKPGIKAAQYRLQGASKNIRIAQSNWYPQLSFGAGLGTSYYKIAGEENISFNSQWHQNFNKYFQFSLSIPLFNRFETRNRVKMARIQRTALSWKLEESKKLLFKEIQQAYYNAVAAESKFKSSRTATESAEASFRLMSEKYANGKATATEYNEMRTNWMKAVSDMLQAKYDYLFRTKILDFYKGVPLTLE